MAHDNQGIRNVRIGLVGLGTTGAAIGRSLHQRPDCTVVSAVDTDPELAGRELGSVLSVPDLPFRINNDLDLLLASRPDVAVVATTSVLTELAPTAFALLASGISVVSICEELSCPYQSHPELTRQLDQAARNSGATLLGTGLNPGLLMDTLPLALSSLLTRVDRIEIRRTADMSGYGGIDSFHSTVAVTVNVTTAMRAAPPGLITMADLPVTALAFSYGRVTGSAATLAASRSRSS